MQSKCVNVKQKNAKCKTTSGAGGNNFDFPRWQGARGEGAAQYPKIYNIFFVDIR
jgi:hypothetical protein